MLTIYHPMMPRNDLEGRKRAIRDNFKALGLIERQTEKVAISH